jgi:co-chaperonin GroES (HSP10)
VCDRVSQSGGSLTVPVVTICSVDAKLLTWYNWLTLLQLQLEDMPQDSKEIFISYAWGGDSEKFVERLDLAFQEKGITIIRDKRDLGYKGLIKEFMERIGRGKCVIAVISDKYLKSPNCMFELVQVSKNGEFHNRIFPIVLADAQIYDPVQRLKYIKHWEEKIKELDESIKQVGAANLQGIREDIDQYTEIRNTIAALANTLKNMNTLTPDIHSQSDFEALFQAIEHQLAQFEATEKKLNKEQQGVELPTVTSANGLIVGRFYRITAKHSGKVLAVSHGSHSNRTSIIQYDWQNGDEQKFRLLRLEGEKEYYFQAKHSGKVIGVSQSSLYDGASLVQFEWQNLDDQKFSLIALPGNYYKIVAKHSERVLAVSEGSRDNGASVIQYEWLDMDEQKFKFEEVLL